MDAVDPAVGTIGHQERRKGLGDEQAVRLIVERQHPALKQILQPTPRLQEATLLLLCFLLLAVFLPPAQ